MSDHAWNVVREIAFAVAGTILCLRPETASVGLVLVGAAAGMASPALRPSSAPGAPPPPVGSHAVAVALTGAAALFAFLHSGAVLASRWIPAA